MSDNANYSEVYHDPETGVAVMSEISPEEFEGFTQGSLLPFPIQRALATWAEEASPASRRQKSLFARDKYVTPGKIMEQMAMAQDALDDDSVGNVADMSESLAFQKMTFECADSQQEDVWKQIGRDLNLDGWIRTAWRELFTASQLYGVRWWGIKEYQVRGKVDKRASRKKFTLEVPTGLGFLDPTRVVPVRPDIFGGSDLAWIATPEEMEQLGKIDELLSMLWVSKYEPSERERKDLQNQEIETDRLILLNPHYVFRHTLTKSPFERWARIRMKSVFPLLDLKHQIREMDRSHIMGAINFLVLVTRGSDQAPAKPFEVEHAASQVRAQSRSPIIVSDHRISVEIITPDMKDVLDKDKWSVLDERILQRLWGTFQLPSQTSGRETSLTLARVIARGIESRRHMLKRTIEADIIKAIQDSPVNTDFTENVDIEFAPRRMELELDPILIGVIQELRDRGDLSRETVLTELNFDQELEARRRKQEDDEYDEIFTPVNVPFDSPNRTTPNGSGRQGGRPPQGQE